MDPFRDSLQISVTVFLGLQTWSSAILGSETHYYAIIIAGSMSSLPGLSE